MGVQEVLRRTEEIVCGLSRASLAGGPRLFLLLRRVDQSAHASRQLPVESDLHRHRKLAVLRWDPDARRPLPRAQGGTGPTRSRPSGLNGDLSRTVLVAHATRVVLV